MFACLCICLSVCPSGRRITLKVMNRFALNLNQRCVYGSNNNRSDFEEDLDYDPDRTNSRKLLPEVCPGPRTDPLDLGGGGG